MLSSIKIRGMVASVIGLALLPLFMFLFGCGGSDEGESREVSVWTSEDTQSSSSMTSTEPSQVDTTPAPVEPEEVVVSEPEPPREVTFAEAESAFHEGRYDAAVEMFAIYTERHGGNPWGFYMLGLSEWKAGNLESAELAFDRALSLDSLHVKSYLNLGRVLIDLGRPEDALVEIRRAIAIEPESNVAYRLTGRVFHEIGQRPQAVDAYRRAIQIDNEDAWSMNNLALVLMDEGLYGEALPPLARAVELKGDNASFFNNLGMALEHTGHFRAAETAYRSAVDIDDTYEKASLNLARVEVVREDPALGPVDLALLAQRFVDEIEGTSETLVASDRPESDESEAGGQEDADAETEEDDIP